MIKSLVYAPSVQSLNQSLEFDVGILQNVKTIAPISCILELPKMKVHIISRELIKPSSPTPSELRDFKLSFIDERIPPFFIPLILYYTNNQSTNQINQPKMVNQLRTSLANTLTEFYPLAGRMKDQIVVDCNDEGVCYLVAGVDVKLQDLNVSPEIQDLDNLIPYKSHGSTSMADEQLAIQVNLFQCGGVAIGFCISHRIADGCSLCTFIKAWSHKARGNSNMMICPVFDSASHFPPRGTPDFKPNTNAAAVQPALERLVAKRFIFTPSAVSEMKMNVINTSPIAQPTRVEVVSALLWKCCIAAKGLDKRGTSAACQPVNLRGKMVPELQDCSFGNIFQVATAIANGEEDWISLVGKLKAAIKKIDSDYTKRLLAENGFELHKKNFMDMNGLISQDDVQVIRYSNWCNFAFYEADFGWGKPAWVSSAGISCKDFVTLFDTKCPGGVEAWVVMADEEMSKLEQDMELKVFTSPVQVD